MKQLEMEDGDTINVVPNVMPDLSPIVTCTESQIQQKDKVTTQARDNVNEHQVDKRTRIRDRPRLPDSNDNVETKSSSQTKNEEMRVEHTHKFRIGDPVWAMLRGFAPWPGKVCINLELRILFISRLSLSIDLYAAPSSKKAAHKAADALCQIFRGQWL